ncbi:MAG TPA: hypothetical protein PLD93_05740, partial [Synergistaceae bacterium]|nr:hypothetical protein [Synergistaceae bacterium]
RKQPAKGRGRRALCTTNMCLSANYSNTAKMDNQKAVHTRLPHKSIDKSYYYGYSEPTADLRGVFCFPVFI